MTSLRPPWKQANKQVAGLGAQRTRSVSAVAGGGGTALRLLPGRWGFHGTQKEGFTEVPPVAAARATGVVLCALRRILVFRIVLVKFCFASSPASKEA